MSRTCQEEMEADIAYIGDEDINQEATALIDRLLPR